MSFYSIRWAFHPSLVIYVYIVLAFLVRMSMFIVHFWLPRPHVQSPVSSSMILVGVLLKLGG